MIRCQEDNLPQGNLLFKLVIVTDEIILVLKPKVVPSLIKNLDSLVNGASERNLGQIVVPALFVNEPLMILG
jgi:hypothetical protein